MPTTAHADPIQNLLSRLSKVKGAGRDEWTACCPAHEDSTPSLCIGRGRNGGVVVNCQAGCATEDVVAAVGLTMADLFEDAPAKRNGNRSGGLGREVCAYPYQDETGALLYEVVRFEPKTFRQRTPDGKWSLNGVRRVLYRLPDVTRAAHAGRTVLVSEGEKDADRLAGENLVATCNAGGAGKWRTEYSESLRGAHVVILPDNDGPGREHAQQVADAVFEVARSVRIVELPGLPAKGDVSDWFDAGGTAADLKETINRTPKWHPAGVDPLPSFVRAIDAPPPDPVQWTAQPIITRGDLGLVVGDGGDGKTTLLLALLGAQAGGYRAFGRFETDAGPVLFVSAEDPSDIIMNRLEAICEGHGWDRERVLSNFYFLAQEGVDLDSSRWWNHLTDEALRIGAKTVAADPLVELTAAEENSNDANKATIRRSRRFTVDTGATLILAHHTGKASEGKRKKDRVRGASVFFSAARFVYLIERDELGMAVECLKLTKAAKPDPFVVTREVKVDHDNPAVWRQATLYYTAGEDAARTGAEEWLLSRIGQGDGPGSRQLKAEGSDAGISVTEISNALKSLSNRGAIREIPGKQNRKHWHPKNVHSEGMHTRNGERAECASERAYAQSETEPESVPPPFREARTLEGGAGDDMHTQPADEIDDLLEVRDAA